jgi:hypothetical protein
MKSNCSLLFITFLNSELGFIIAFFQHSTATSPLIASSFCFKLFDLV